MSFGVISFVGLVVALSPQITNEKLFSEHTITRIELPHAPISRLQLDIPLGQLSDPSKKAGLAQITAETLRLELSDQFENLEVRVTPSSTALSLWLEPKMLAPSLGQLLSAITELSKRATLQESFKYARANVVQRQQRTGTNNKVLLDRGLQRLRLRTTAKPLFSRIAGMKECQLEDVKQRFQDWPKLRAIKIIVAGPDLGAVTAGAGKTLRQFVNEKDDPPKQATPTVSTEPISKQRRILVVDRPGQREVSAVLFQPRQSLSASWNLIARIANAGVSRLRYGAFGRTIRHHRGALEKMERSSPGLGISFRCAPDKLVRIVRDLDQRWLKTRDGGLPLADIEAGRQLVRTEILNSHASTRDLVRMIAGGNELPSTEDRELTAAQQVNSVSNEQVHALLNENLTTTPMDLVLVTNASGQLLKALEQLPDVESIAVIAADALY